MYALSPAKSDFLNMLRWMAAMVVVVGHADMYLGQFGGGEPARWASFGYLGKHSHAAVMVFFVLSGYVVAYATDKKAAKGNHAFSSYFLDRWSRIYSVLLVALAFTAALDLVGRFLSRYYSDPAFLPQHQYVFRLLANLFALQGVQGYRIQFGSNPALWSIGYEFSFYMMFGLFHFRQQLFKRAWMAPLLVAFILALLGWKMAVYFVIWLMGVLAYKASVRTTMQQHGLSDWQFLLILLLANHFIVFDDVLKLPEVCRDVLFGLILALMLSFNLAGRVGASARMVTFNSYMADFSYSLYAFHMPLIFFLCSMLFEREFQYWPRVLPGVLLVSGCLVVARLFFLVSESRRAAFRQIGARALSRFG